VAAALKRRASQLLLTAESAQAEQGPRRVPHAVQKEVDRSTHILPEDMAMIHIDVERFYNLLKLYGSKDPAGFLREWTKEYEIIVPPASQQGAESMEEMLVEMAGQTAILGMDVSDISAHIVRRSIVANLSKVYQEICGIMGGAAIGHGVQNPVLANSSIALSSRSGLHSRGTVYSDAGSDETGGMRSQLHSR
jgi:hypothetical protein